MVCKHTLLFATVVTSTLACLATTLNQICFVEELLSKTSAIRCGAEDLVGLTKQRFMDRLTWVKYLMRFNLTNWNDRKTFERVSHTLEMLKLDNSNGSIRKQPYCILLTGYPGCGKSNYALKLAVACLKAKFGKAHANDIVTLNETDEFQSEYRSSHKVVIFDDLGADKPTPNTPNPWRKVIDFVNNIRKTSLNPNVEMKGNVYIQPDIVIITTNLSKTFDTVSYCRAPSAVYRRLRKIIHLEDGFDKASVMNIQYQTQQYEGKAVFDTNGEAKVSDEIVLRTNLLKEVVEEYLIFDKEQEKFVNETNSILDRIDEKSIFKCFYDDIIEPILPKVINLPDKMEKQLPWYHRFIRKFCQKKNIAVCMNNYIPQGGCITIETNSNKSLFEYINKLIDWEYYNIIKHQLVSENIYLYDGAIYDQHHYFTWKNFSVPRDDNVIGICTTKDQLEEVYKLYSSIDEEPIIATLYWNYRYKSNNSTFMINLDDKQFSDMNNILKYDNLGSLKKSDTMAIVQYTIAYQALRIDLECKGVEFQILGYTPDVVLKDDDTYIVIECKNAKTNHNGNRQLRNYLNTFREKEYKAIGVLFTQHSIKIYSLDRCIKEDTLVKLKYLFICSLNYLSRRSKLLGTDHFSKIDRCGAVEPCICKCNG